MRTLAHSFYMTLRHFRNLMRQPLYIAFTLVQPIIWLVLFGQLFKKVVLLPGFGASAYVDFLTPGVVIMTVLFGAGWSGMGIIRDLDLGVMDRFLVSPASRVALIAGRLIQLALIAVIQSVLIVVLGMILGARFPGGVRGVGLLIVCAVLLAVPIGALSSAMALVARKEETVIAASNFILLPLTFLSSVFMAGNLMPGWIQAVARFNPVEWAVIAGRSALSAHISWPLVATRIGFLVALTIVTAGLATRAFRIYQRSV
ncbi:MAG TPA: ABC transporter permease [Terriglobia bacterium]|nr:ABC transporter permease [Terriglobia bacterium]